MTTEERLERIETILQSSAESQAAWQQTYRKAMDGLIEAHALSQKNIATLSESISRYIDAADARMRSVEETSPRSSAPSPPNTPTAKPNTEPPGALDRAY